MQQTIGVEMSERYFLQFLDPDYIVSRLIEHPIVWCDDRDITRRGGLADQAGKPPLSCVGLFHDWVSHERTLPTQAEYIDFGMAKLLERSWPRPHYEDAYRQKLAHNFYPSCVDQYHAFGLVSQAGWYQRCSMDSVEDMLGKADLTFHTQALAIRVNLKGPTTEISKDAERYKTVFRDHGFDGVVQIRMPYGRERNPGNKRWYMLRDFNAIQPTYFGPELIGR